MRIISLIFMTIFAVLSVSANDVDKVGEGKYTWFGIKIYDARLFAPKGFNGDFETTSPIVLEIEYDMDIDSKDLVETTQDEWKDLKIGRSETCKNQVAWAGILSVIWPDLKQGDKLRLNVDNNRVSQFFYNEKSIGLIDDPDFATCFLAIWLAEDSSADDLREDLLAL